MGNSQFRLLQCVVQGRIAILRVLGGPSLGEDKTGVNVGIVSTPPPLYELRTQSKPQTSGKNWVWWKCQTRGTRTPIGQGDSVSPVTQMMNFLMPGPNNPVYANQGQWGAEWR